MTLVGSDGEAQDPRITARLAEILAQAPILFDHLGAVARAGVSPGSEAAKDASVPLGRHVRIMAIDHLSTGIEHLAMWHRLLIAGVQPNTVHMTLIRGAMEGAVTCRWLIDTREDSAERVRRSVALLLDDYGNRRDFERDFGIPAHVIKPPAKSGAERYTELRTERDAAGIGRTKVPSMTYRFGGYIGLPPARGRAIYRLLSAYAHGKQWKGLTARFEVVEGALEVPDARLVKVTANDDMSVVLTALGVTTATTALNELETYVGSAAIAGRPVSPPADQSCA
jgi:hypothetical protein